MGLRRRQAGSVRQRPGRCHPQALHSHALAPGRQPHAHSPCHQERPAARRASEWSLQAGAGRRCASRREGCWPLEQAGQAPSERSPQPVQSSRSTTTSQSNQCRIATHRAPPAARDPPAERPSARFSGSAADTWAMPAVAAAGRTMAAAAGPVHPASAAPAAAAAAAALPQPRARGRTRQGRPGPARGSEWRAGRRRRPRPLAAANQWWSRHPAAGIAQVTGCARCAGPQAGRAAGVAGRAPGLCRAAGRAPSPLVVRNQDLQLSSAITAASAAMPGVVQWQFRGAARYCRLPGQLARLLDCSRDYTGAIGTDCRSGMRHPCCRRSRPAHWRPLHCRMHLLALTEGNSG